MRGAESEGAFHEAAPTDAAYDHEEVEMIQIDTDTTEVVFATDEHVRERRFPLVCAHVCSHCGLVLTAGFMTDAPLPVHGYEEPPAISADVSRYATQHVGNCQLIARNRRARDDIRSGRVGDGGCSYFAYTLDDPTTNLRVLLAEEAGVVVPAERIDPTRLPTDQLGLRLVEDLCGRFGSVLLFDPDEFAGGCWNFKRESWETYWHRRKDAIGRLYEQIVREPRPAVEQSTDVHDGGRTGPIVDPNTG